MNKKIWDFWAKRYDRLWVQKYSLCPTRKKVKEILLSFKTDNGMNMLDIGCGIGELLYDLRDVQGLHRSGLDFSKNMIEESKKRNKDVNHYNLDVENILEIKEKFNVITCTHSFPYYKSQRDILEKVHTLLKKDGRAIFAFASGNTLLDKIIMLFVKVTTGPASYPSDRQFKKLIDGLFQIELRKEIRRHLYVPTIAIYSLKKVEK